MCSGDTAAEACCGLCLGAGELEEREREKKGIWTKETARKGLRIGVIKEGLEVMGLTPEVKAIIEEAAAQFKAAGADVQEVPIPMHTWGWINGTDSSRARIFTE